MTDTDTITLTRAQYEALLAEKETLADQVAARDADDGSRIPHEVALAIRLRPTAPRMPPCGDQTGAPPNSVSWAR